MNFCKMLKKDHEEVKGIIGKLNETKEKESSKREDLFQKLREELVPHMKAEESAFYPLLMEKKEAREDAMEGIEEHHVSELVLKELEVNRTSGRRRGPVTFREGLFFN